MRNLIAALMLAFLFASPAYGQAYLPGRNVTDDNPQPMKSMCWNGTAYAACNTGSGASVVTRGSGAINTGQVSVGTTATQVVAARTGRSRVIFTVGAATACAFGNPGVTLTTGFPTQPVAGASISLSTTAAVSWVCSGTTTIGFVEEF